jgi:subtilase family serine protease
MGNVRYINIAAQRAWGWDYLWPHYATISSEPSEAAMAADPLWIAGSGGGYSVSERRPPYQSVIANIGSYTADPYLSPTTFANFPGTSISLPTKWLAWADGGTGVVPPPATITGTAAGRAVPDLSTDADPDTGYLLYFSKQSPALEPGWGGTSFGAPQLNGSAAVIDSFLHHRVGFWNPVIYRFAAHSYTPFTPLNASGANNDNLYYTGTAGHIYNPGTGLGVPNLGKLALAFKNHG